MSQLVRVIELMGRINLSIMSTKMHIRVHYDQKHEGINEPRIYIQMEYSAPDIKGQGMQSYKGGKWYLSKHMTDDEIVKKAYLAFRTAVEHEVLEGFRVDNVAIFNPHRNFEDLIKLGGNPEIKRREYDQGTTI